MFAWAVAAPLALTVVGVAPASRLAPGAIQVPADKRLLLDASLSQWIIPAGGAERVRLVDGVLTVDETAEWVLTRAGWGDFALSFEFRVRGQFDRASLLIRARTVDDILAQIEQGDDWSDRAVRDGYVLVLSDGSGRTGGFRSLRPGGQPAELVEASAPQALDGDAWHALRVGCSGGSIAVMLDDRRVLTGSHLRLRTGRFGFIVERGSLELRHAVVTGLPIYRKLEGVTTPRLVRDVTPSYTTAALERRIEGEVWLEAVVLPDGTVGDVTVVRSLDPTFGLDQAAVQAARQWLFVPGRRAGQPVPVLVTIQMKFRVRRDRQ